MAARVLWEHKVSWFESRRPDLGKAQGDAMDIPLGTGRLEMDDPRDEDYPVSTLLEQTSGEEKPYQYWWTSGSWLDQGQTPQCFPPGTMVTMADGSEKPIEELKAGERVLTPEGNAKMVESVMAREYEGELVNMKAQGYTNPILSTPEHPWLITELEVNQSRTNDVPRGRIIPEKTEWIEAKNISTYSGHDGGGGPALNIPRVKPSIDSDPQIDIRDYIDDHRIKVENEKIRIHGCQKKGAIDRYVRVSKQLGRLIGLYLAEGHVRTDRNSSLHLSFGGHEKELAEESANIIERIFEINTHYRERPNNVIRLNAYSSTLSALFEGMFGNGCDNKGFADVMWSWPDCVLEQVWSGFKDGDGWEPEDKDKIVLTTVSEQLARDLWRLGNRLGWMPSLNLQSQDDKHDAYRLCCYRVSDMEDGVMEDGVMDDWGRKQKWSEDLIHCPVTEVCREEYDGLVYNLQVSDDRSYIADGFATHNCVAYAWVHWLEDGPVTHFYEDRDFDPWYEDPSQDPLFNCEKIYNEAQKKDRWPGESYDGTSVRAGAKVLQDRGAIEEYRWGQTVKELKQAVLNLGPVVAGTRWYKDMYWPNLDGVVNVGGEKVGGHAYVINGVNVEKRLFRVKNSWSRDWGADGHFYIPFSDMKKLIEEGGEFCFAQESAVEDG